MPCLAPTIGHQLAFEEKVPTDEMMQIAYQFDPVISSDVLSMAAFRKRGVTSMRRKPPFQSWQSATPRKYRWLIGLSSKLFAELFFAMK